MEEMTNAAAMSVRNLNRRFVSATGLSPQQYLRRVRIETAKRLLESRSLRSIALPGRSDTATRAPSSEQFGAVAGLSPGEYRRQFRAHADITSR